MRTLIPHQGLSNLRSLRVLPPRRNGTRLTQGHLVHASRAGTCVLLVGDAASQAGFLSALGRTGIQLAGPGRVGGIAQVVGSGRNVGAALVDVDSSEASYDLVWQLAELEYPCRSILVGSEIDERTMREAFLAGVTVCLRKPLIPRLLAVAVRNALDSTRLARACIEGGASLEALARPSSGENRGLTPRERQVFTLLLAAKKTRVMADELKVTPRTVKYHVANVLKKYGVRSRIELLAKSRAELAGEL